MRGIINGMIIGSFMSGALFMLGCGGSQKPANNEDQARKEMEQLIVLYKEDRPKFVVQLQQMEQEKGCARVTKMLKEINKMKEEADMKPGNSQDITIVQMEITEANKKCQAK
jgi:hypothetical protein